MSSAATEKLPALRERVPTLRERVPTLRERVGGKWFGSWAMWALSMPAGLLVITSDLTTADSPAVIGRWLVVWMLATAVDAVAMWALQRTILRGRIEHPWPVWAVVVTGGLFGAFYGALLWGAATLLGAQSPHPWGLRITAMALIGLWFIPLINVTLDTVARGRAQRERDIDALVRAEMARLEEVEVARDLREEIRVGVVDALDPLRLRVDAALHGLEAGGSLVSPALASELRDGAEASVRPLSRDLWGQAAARYPRIPWERVIGQTIRTQPLRPLVLAMASLMGDGIFIITAMSPGAAIPFVAVTTAAVVALSAAANALMRRWPRQHALWFLLGGASLLAVGLGALVYRNRVWGQDITVATVMAWAVLSVATIVVTSGFGSWRSETNAVRAAFRAEVDSEFIAARVHGQQLADIARDAARVLHGSVQSRLVACAMAIDRASGSGDREGLLVALAAAREALEEPLPERGGIAGSIADEVTRKVSLWGDACDFTIDVDSAVSTSGVEPLIVGRVVEEGLTNAIRHGQATAISVSVGVESAGVVIVVADDGVGPGAVTAGLGSALLDQATGGAWSLQRVGERTVLRAHVPASRVPTGTSLSA